MSHENRCDQTFDALTRGPFPTGDASLDAMVEAHLTVCHDCRCLAEALRPAATLLHESLPGDEATLPGYLGDLPRRDAVLPDLVDAVMQRVATLPPPQPMSPSVSPAPRGLDEPPGENSVLWGRAVATLALCIVILLGLHAILGQPAETATTPPPAFATSPTEALPSREALAAFPLTDSCRGQAAARSGVPTTSNLACCARCHHRADVGDPDRSTVLGRWTPQTLAVVSRSCAVCH